MEESEFIVETEHLKRTFRVGVSASFTAVDDVNIQIRKGETYGLVGESGAGKSTVTKLILGLDRPTDGSVRFDGIDLSAITKKQLRREHGRMGSVFQDPVASLNPRKTIEQIVSSPLVVHERIKSSHARERVEEVLEQVGLSPSMRSRHPKELSGGQCQRVNIARAIIRRPSFVVLDEAVSALDVSIRAQILNLLRRLQVELRLTYLFVSHDLAVVHYMADSIAVMRNGAIIERGTRDELFHNPRDGYTQALLAAIPRRSTMHSSN